MTDPSAPAVKMTPEARSSYIIGGSLGIFIFIAVLAVAWKAREIRKERDVTKALNSQADAGEMVWLPEGKMTMGAIDGGQDEQPIRDVKISGFWMDRMEVTNEDFAKFVKATKYVTGAERPGADGVAPGGWVLVISIDGSKWQQIPGATWQHPEGPQSTIVGHEKDPVVQVSHEDAAAYAKWAGKRLPTEAEWEYAARAGNTHMPFVWGRELTPGGHWFANVWQGPLLKGGEAADGYEGRAPVGSYRSNEYGLADMAGNVWEWTADWYRADYYVKGPRRDPAGPTESMDPMEPGVVKRVARGGSFLSSETNGAGYRPAARGKHQPGYAAFDLGFRCARGVKQ